MKKFNNLTVVIVTYKTNRKIPTVETKQYKNRGRTNRMFQNIRDSNNLLWSTTNTLTMRVRLEVLSQL